MVKADEVANEKARTALSSACAPRRPYATPELRSLGTVYELTLTGAGSVTELFSVPKVSGS